jgi:predicted MFS family arabinose efflux permease
MSPQEAQRLRRTLYAAAFLRALAIGLMAVLIGLYAARLGLSAAQIGVVLSAALWGGALAALLTLIAGARIPDRVLLVTLCTLPALGGAIFLAGDDFKLLTAAAFVGMFNVHGRDRGAIPIVEQALFPATTSDAQRTRVFAWYNVLLDAGYAAGGLLAALPALLETVWGLGTLEAMRASLALFCALYAAAAVLYARLPRRLSGVTHATLRELSPASRPIVAKISALFLLDAFGGGFIGSALLAYFFAERFGVPAAQVAILFAAGRLLSAFSHLAAAWLAKRIGLINTMVFTHIPTSLLLFTIAATDDFAWAAFFFLLREALNEMDVPTRQSYVMAVVDPRERLAASGVTNLVRSVGWASAPMLAGVMMQAGGLGLPLVVAGVTKITYDLLLWREFRRVRPPEELEPG